MSEMDTAQWPPPPLRPSVDVQELERVRVARTEDRMTVINFAAKRALWIGLLLALLPGPFALLMILATFLRSDSSAAGREKARRLLVLVLHLHFLQFVMLSATAALLFSAWFIFTHLRHRGLFTLGKEDNTLRMGDRESYPLSELETVKSIPFVSQLGKRWLVQFVRQGGDPRLRWLQLMTYPDRPDVTTIASFRKREHAEQIATILADFAGVEVLHSSK